MARLNGNIYVGGFFNTVSDPTNTTTGLQHLFSFDEATSEVRNNFVARANAEVFALEAGNGALYVAGAFRSINGRVTGPLAKLDPATGAVDTNFRPPFTSGAVNQVVLRNGILYVGGTFSQHLLALNPDTGANTGDINLDIANPIPNAFGPVAIFKFAVTNAGDRLVATGNFQRSTPVAALGFRGQPGPPDRGRQPERLVLPRLRQAVLDDRAAADCPAPRSRLVT